LKQPVHDTRGVTLIELLVTIAVMAILFTVAAVSVKGFLSGGKEKAYNTERETLQLAVDTWRNSIGKTTGPLYPILETGDVTGCIQKALKTGDLLDPISGALLDATCNPYLDIAALADQEFLKSAGAVKSANTTLLTTATKRPVNGSYGWFVNTGGLVDSIPEFTKGLYP